MKTKDIDPSHMYISFVKSAVRIVAGVLLIGSGIEFVMYAGLLLVVAEVLGVLEEIVQMDFYLYSILLLLVICTCCITSFRSGRNEGLQLGIERSLQILIDQKIVYLDEDSEIHQYDSKTGKRARKLDREKYIPK